MKKFFGFVCVALVGFSAFAGSSFYDGPVLDAVAARVTVLEGSTSTAATVALSNNVTVLNERADTMSNAVAAVCSSFASYWDAAITTNANGGTNAVKFTSKDTLGATKSGYSIARVWISDTSLGAPSAVAGAFTVSGGLEVQEIVDKADYWVLTSTTGTVTCTVSDTPGATNFINVVIGGGVTKPYSMAWNVVP